VNDKIPSDRATTLDDHAGPSPAVSTFVAAAIAKQRRDDAFSKLRADMLAAGDPEAEVAPARVEAAAGVS
jgi:hypothetical protein